MAKPQEQPELVSGINNNPPTGIIPIQQPGRVTLLIGMVFGVLIEVMAGFTMR